jgi:hypothetical protein
MAGLWARFRALGNGLGMMPGTARGKLDKPDRSEL